MQKRRHAAIMFTDIVGYTALMGSDEDRAFEVLRKNREIHTELIQKFHGKLIKEMGDGMLVSFNLASDAVRCAIDIQRFCKNQNIPLKIGIHEGEMVFSGADVLGDGVNIASRLQEDAEEGFIYISGSVYIDIKNKADLKVKFFKEKSFKNVDEPIKVYKVEWEEAEKIKAQIASPGQPTKPSIAVLPFENMSPDQDQEYFCDGMTEEIINTLSHIESLKVIARTSAFVFKRKHEDVREIGRKLEVETLLEGSVRKVGNRIRITSQLIKVSDGSHIWSDAYNRKLEDVFGIQEEISLAIVDNLKVKLLGKEKAAIIKRYTEDLEAYNLYLKGIYYARLFSIKGFKKAIECFEQSLQKDSNYSLAYRGLAEVFVNSPFFGNVRPNEAYPKAKEYLKKALEIDNTLAEAHSGLGFIYMNYDWNWNAAEKEFKQALQLNLNSADTHHSYSLFLTFAKRHDEAIAEAKQAQVLDPLSIFINTFLGLVYFYAGQYDRAIEEQQLALTLNPGYFLAHYNLGIANRGKLMIKEAIREYETAVDFSGGAPMIVSCLACAYYEIGKKEQAEKLINSLEQKLKKEYVPPSCFIPYHLLRGDLDQAYKWLERAIDEHDAYLYYWISLPIEIYRITDDPRFNTLLKKVGLMRKGK